MCMAGQKDFMVDVPFNTQNNRVYGMDKKDKIPSSQLFIMQTKNPKRLWFLLV